MYRVTVAVAPQARADALAQMVALNPHAEHLAVSVCAVPSELEARLDAGEYPDILIIDPAFGPCSLSGLAEGADGGVPCAVGLPGGVDLVRRRLSGGGVQVVYVSARPEYVTEVYRTPHVYHLVEPFVQADLDDALDRAVANFRTVANRPIAVRSDGRLQVVYPRRISFIESDRRKCHIHAGNEVLTTYATLDSLAHELPPSFVRSHKSFLVNMGFIESMDGSHIQLSTGDVVPVSQKRRRATSDAFLRYNENCKG